MKHNIIKSGVLACLVFINMVYVIPVQAKEWGYRCDTDKITGEVTGHIYGPDSIGDKREFSDISSSIYYSQNKNDYWIYIHFNYLNIDSTDALLSNKITLQQIFKPDGAPERGEYTIKNSRWLFFKEPGYASTLEKLKTQNEFLIRIPYFSLGDVTFSHALTGFQSALTKMQTDCKI